MGIQQTSILKQVCVGKVCPEEIMTILTGMIL